MALDLAGLTADLAAFFAALPATEAECATQWSDIIRSYTTGIVPAVAGGVQDGAKSAMAAALAGMSNPSTGIDAFDGGFAAYAAALAAGMAPAGAVPPPAPLSDTMSAVYSSNNSPSVTPTQAATSMAGVIDAWFKTGVGGPPGSVPWS